MIEKKKIIDKRYLKSYIYGIYCYTTKKLYIGSSFKPMKTRLSNHKTDMRGYMGELNCYRNYRSSLDVLINDDYKMFKIEDYPCNNRYELHKRESIHIIKARLKDINIVNVMLPRRCIYTASDLSSVPCPCLT